MNKHFHFIVVLKSLVLTFYRLKNAESVVKEVSRLVRLNPMAVSHISEALFYLVTTETLLNDAPEVCILFVMQGYILCVKVHIRV